MPNTKLFVEISIAISLASLLLLLRNAGLSLSVQGVGISLPITIASSLLVSRLYRTGGNVMVSRFVKALECLALLSIISLIGAVASYPAAALSSGWEDDAMLAADRALGWDWLTYWKFVQAHPVIKNILSFSYSTIGVTPVLLIVLLVGTGRIDRVYRLLAAFALALFVTDLLLIAFPAKSAAAIFLASDDPTMPQAGFAHIAIIDHLRQGSYGPVHINQVTGLIAFPSFHAACCILFAWAAWDMRYWRYPLLALNGAMLLSTPIDGGHYFIDVIGGCVAAFSALAFVRVLPGISSTSRSHSLRYAEGDGLPHSRGKPTVAVHG